MTNAYLYPKKRLNTYRYIFFDLDRTLWDFETNSKEALTDIFHELRLEKYFSGPEEFVKIYHYHNNSLWESYRHGRLKKETLRSLRFNLTLRDADIHDPVLAGLIGDKYLKLITEKTTLFPFTIEILDYLFPKYSLYILTNGFEDTQYTKLKNGGLCKYFKFIFTSDTIGFNKPHPKIFQWAVSSLNARKKECLMVGDDFEGDILGAKYFGMDQVYFNPYGRQFTEAVSYEIRSLIELKNIL